MQFWTVDLTFSRVQFCTAQQTTKTARGGARELPMPQPRIIVCWVQPPRHTHTRKRRGLEGGVRGLQQCCAAVQCLRTRWGCSLPEHTHTHTHTHRYTNIHTGLLRRILRPRGSSVVAQVCMHKDRKAEIPGRWTGHAWIFIILLGHPPRVGLLSLPAGLLFSAPVLSQISLVCRGLLRMIWSCLCGALCRSAMPVAQP